MYLDVSLGVSACGGSDKCDYNYVASYTGHEVQSSAAWDLKNVADDGIAYQPCPFRDFQQSIFAPAIFGPKFITNQCNFDNNSPRWPLQSRSRPQNVLICFSKWLHQGHVLSVSVRRRNLLGDRCVLRMICLRKQAAAMVVMNRRFFELASSFPASGKIHEHFVLPECEKKKTRSLEYHIVLNLACVWL